MDWLSTEDWARIMHGRHLFLLEEPFPLNEQQQDGSEVMCNVGELWERVVSAKAALREEGE